MKMYMINENNKFRFGKAKNVPNTVELLAETTLEDGQEIEFFVCAVKRGRLYTEIVTGVNEDGSSKVSVFALDSEFISEFLNTVAEIDMDEESQAQFAFKVVNRIPRAKKQKEVKVEEPAVEEVVQTVTFYDIDEANFHSCMDFEPEEVAI